MERLRTLVVDDELGMRLSIRKALSKYHISYPDIDEEIGFEVDLAEDGKEALLIRLYAKGTKDEQWLRTSQYKYNAVYIDSPDEIIDYA